MDNNKGNAGTNNRTKGKLFKPGNITINTGNSVYMPNKASLVNSGIQTCQAAEKRIGIEINNNLKMSDIVKKKTPTNKTTNYQNLNNHYNLKQQHSKLRGLSGSSGNQEKFIYKATDSTSIKPNKTSAQIIQSTLKNQATRSVSSKKPAGGYHHYENPTKQAEKKIQLTVNKNKMSQQLVSVTAQNNLPQNSRPILKNKKNQGMQKNIDLVKRQSEGASHYQRQNYSTDPIVQDQINQVQEQNDVLSDCWDSQEANKKSLQQNQRGVTKIIGKTPRNASGNSGSQGIGIQTPAGTMTTTSACNQSFHFGYKNHQKGTFVSAGSGGRGGSSGSNPRTKGGRYRSGSNKMIQKAQDDQQSAQQMVNKTNAKSLNHPRITINTNKAQGIHELENVNRGIMTTKTTFVGREQQVSSTKNTENKNLIQIKMNTKNAITPGSGVGGHGKSSFINFKTGNSHQKTKFDQQVDKQRHRQHDDQINVKTTIKEKQLNTGTNFTTLNYVQTREVVTTKSQQREMQKKQEGIQTLKANIRFQKQPGDKFQIEKPKKQYEPAPTSNSGAGTVATVGHSNLLNKLGKQNLINKSKNHVYQEYFHANGIGQQKKGQVSRSKGGASVNQNCQEYRHDLQTAERVRFSVSQVKSDSNDPQKETNDRNQGIEIMKHYQTLNAEEPYSKTQQSSEKYQSHKINSLPLNNQAIISDQVRKSGERHGSQQLTAQQFQGSSKTKGTTQISQVPTKSKKQSNQNQQNIRDNQTKKLKQSNNIFQQSFEDSKAVISQGDITNASVDLCDKKSQSSQQTRFSKQTKKSKQPQAVNQKESTIANILGSKMVQTQKLQISGMTKKNTEKQQNHKILSNQTKAKQQFIDNDVAMQNFLNGSSKDRLNQIEQLNHNLAPTESLPVQSQDSKLSAQLMAAQIQAEKEKQQFYQQELKKRDNIVLFLCEKMQGMESQIDLLRHHQNKSNAHNVTQNATTSHSYIHQIDKLSPSPIESSNQFSQNQTFQQNNQLMKNISYILNKGYRDKLNESTEDNRTVSAEQRDQILDVEALQKLLFKKKKTQELGVDGDDLSQILRQKLNDTSDIMDDEAQNLEEELYDDFSPQQQTAGFISQDKIDLNQNKKEKIRENSQQRIEQVFNQMEDKLEKFKKFNNPKKMADLRKYCATSITNNTGEGISSRLQDSGGNSGGTIPSQTLQGSNSFKNKTNTRHFQSTSDVERNSLITVGEEHSKFTKQSNRISESKGAVEFGDMQSEKTKRPKQPSYLVQREHQESDPLLMGAKDISSGDIKGDIEVKRLNKFIDYDEDQADDIRELEKLVHMQEQQTDDQNNSLEILGQFWKDQDQHQQIESNKAKESQQILSNFKIVSKQQFIRTQKVSFENDIETQLDKPNNSLVASDKIQVQIAQDYANEGLSKTLSKETLIKKFKKANIKNLGRQNINKNVQTFNKPEIETKRMVNLMGSSQLNRQQNLIDTSKNTEPIKLSKFKLLDKKQIKKNNFFKNVSNKQEVHSMERQLQRLNEMEENEAQVIRPRKEQSRAENGQNANFIQQQHPMQLQGQGQGQDQIIGSDQTMFQNFLQQQDQVSQSIQSSSLNQNPIDTTFQPINMSGTQYQNHQNDKQNSEHTISSIPLNNSTSFTQNQTPNKRVIKKKKTIAVNKMNIVDLERKSQRYAL